MDRKTDKKKEEKHDAREGQMERSKTNMAVSIDGRRDEGQTDKKRGHTERNQQMMLMMMMEGWIRAQKV